MPRLDLTPLTPKSIPDADSAAFQDFLDDYFAFGVKVAQSMDFWLKHSTKVDGTVQIVTLTSASSMSHIRKELDIKEHWCGRISTHDAESVSRYRSAQSTNAGSDPMNENSNDSLYDRFKTGLLDNHSENERQYIESCRETECLQVYQKHVAEVWRLSYVTPPPTSSRTFVILLLSREIATEPDQRSFINISLPFDHPSCQEKQGGEVSRVRGRYVSVEKVTETHDGRSVEWRMATSSDAGGNIPRFVTNASLPKSISEDVPAFLKFVNTLS